MCKDMPEHIISKGLVGNSEKISWVIEKSGSGYWVLRFNL